MPIDFDSFKHVKGTTKRIVKNWIKMESPRNIPWTPLNKPVKNANVALISSGGIVLNDDKPFDTEGERANPWWGDPSFRIIRGDTKSEQISCHHLHINPDFVHEDINCLLPIDRMKEFEKEGLIKKAGPSHYSYMGYILDPEELLSNYVPQMISNLKNESIDLVILVPA